MFKKLVRFFYLKLKHKSKKLKMNSLNVPVKSVFGYLNTIETGVYIDGEFEIGDFSYINKNTFLSNVLIGKFTSISSNCSIGGAEHPTSYFTTHPIIFNSYYGAKKIISNRPKKTLIGNDVWIGHGAVIKQGVIISDGAVIAAGAVVTKNVPCYEIWAGVPAKKIKARTVRKLPYGVKEWWNIDVKRIQSWEEY